MSKKNTWRGWASTGSIGRLPTVAWCSSLRTVILSSTVSEAFIVAISSTSSRSLAPLPVGLGRHRLSFSNRQLPKRSASTP